MKNPTAVALGKMAKGVPKNVTNAERARRKQRMAKARESRWPKIRVAVFSEAMMPKNKTR